MAKVRGKPVVAVALASLLLGGASCSRGSSERALSAEEMCEVLAEVDPGPAFAGGSAEDLAFATKELAALDGRVPDDLRDAVAVVADRASEQPAVLDLPGLSQEDDGYAAGFQAAYALRFDSQLSVAAALIERYGVDECGLEASGLFDIEAVRDSDLQGADIPVLTQEDLEALKVEFDPAEFGEFELQPFEVPEVQFDEDFGQFKLDPPEYPTPDLGG